MKILAVEDDKLGQFTYEAICKHLGLEVQIVDCGEDALELLKDNQYDVIILDWKLPGMSGPTCVEHIRKIQIDSDIWTPIIAVTAHAMPDYRKICLEVGMDYFMSKPFEIDEFDRVMKHWATEKQRSISARHST